MLLFLSNVNAVVWMWAQEEGSELRLRGRARLGDHAEEEVGCGNIPSRSLILYHRLNFEVRC